MLCIKTLRTGRGAILQCHMCGIPGVCAIADYAHTFLGRRLLSWLGNEGHPNRALEVFDWLEGRREYVTEVCILYTRLASMLSRHKGGLETAMRLFERMQARGIRPDTVAFNSAINVASELLTALQRMLISLLCLHVHS